MTEKTLADLPAQLRGIREQCKKHGIPPPTSFAYPGNAITKEALAVWFLPLIARAGGNATTWAGLTKSPDGPGRAALRVFGGGWLAEWRNVMEQLLRGTLAGAVCLCLLLPSQAKAASRRIAAAVLDLLLPLRRRRSRDGQVCPGRRGPSRPLPVSPQGR